MRLAIVILFFSSICYSQIPDSLAGKTTKEIYSKAVESWRYDDELNPIYLQTLKLKAAQDGTEISKLWVYHILGLISKDTVSNSYADSIITVSQKISNDKYLATGYFLKGRNYYRTRDYKSSLDHFLLTNDILEKTGDSVTLNYLVKDNIGLIRLLIGENQEAITLYKELLEHYKDKSPDNYLYTLFNLGVAYHQDMEYKTSQEYIDQGLALAKETGSEGYFFLLSVYGANQYAFGNYQTAIDSLERCLPFFKEIEDYTNESISCYYIGKSYKELGMDREAKVKLDKVDSIFQSTLDIYPLTRNAWETLIDYSRDAEDTEAELYYIKSLLKVDSVISDNYKYVNSNLMRKYDVPQLIKDKERLINRYKSQNSTYVLIIGILVVVSLLGFFIYKKVEGKKIEKYKRIIAEYDSNKEEKKTPKPSRPSGISEVVLERISNGLKELEASKFYLDPKASVSSVAKELETNGRYVSKYINQYEGKPFPDYINDLRVIYLIKRLRDDASFRKYTLDAMAKESGFSDSQYMSKAFMKKEGIKPAFFLKQIQKEKMGDS